MYFKSSLDCLYYLIQCKWYVNSCWHGTNLSFAFFFGTFWNFFLWTFSMYNWWTLGMQNPWIQRAKWNQNKLIIWKILKITTTILNGDNTRVILTLDSYGFLNCKVQAYLFYCTPDTAFCTNWRFVAIRCCQMTATVFFSNNLF